MKVLPVLDLQDGQVVHAVAGQRDQYCPLRSVWTESARPDAVALALRQHFGFDQLYVADLDQIRQRGSNRSAVAQLARLGFRLVVDAGVREAADAVRVLEAGASVVVAALETLADPQELAAAVQRLGCERVWFSLDLKHGQPLGRVERWTAHDRCRPKTRSRSGLSLSGLSSPELALQIAARAAQCGVRSFIVLDLAAVGVGRGVPTSELCRRLLAQDRSLRVYTGGGVRGVADLVELERAGVSGVLVGTALHNGTLSRSSLSPWLLSG